MGQAVSLFSAYHRKPETKEICINYLVNIITLINRFHQKNDIKAINTEFYEIIRTVSGQNGNSQ